MPAGETALLRYLNRNGYQLRNQAAAYRQLKKARVAVDVGSHIGLWSRHMASLFRQVVAFEPMRVARDCYVLNVSMDKVVLYGCALGAEAGNVLMRYNPELSMETVVHTVMGGGEGVEICTLDSFALDEVDLVKIDVEGYEPFVIEGARDTIERCRPVVVIEQKGHGAEWGFERYAALRMLMEMGMLPRDCVVDDVVMVWP